MPPYGDYQNPKSVVPTYDWMRLDTPEKLGDAIYKEAKTYHKHLYHNHGRLLQDVQPRLTTAAVVRAPVMESAGGWWGEKTPGTNCGDLALDLLQRAQKTREQQRKRDKLRRVDMGISNQKHERKVQDAMKEGNVPQYKDNDVIGLVKSGDMERKDTQERVADYLLFTLPRRGVVYCPVSDQYKISSAIAIRRDIVEGGDPLSGPPCISTRAFTNLSVQEKLAAPPATDSSCSPRSAK